MKRFCIFLFVVLAVVALWFFPKTNTAQHPGKVKINQPTQANPSLVVAATNSQPLIRAGTDPDYGKYYLEEKAKDPQFDWKRPINFWGKLVDEKEQPIVQASIKFTWNDISTNGTSEAEAITDTNGLFSLSDRRGKRLYVQASKEGYYNGPRASMAFEYANPYDGLFVPDQNSPALFQLKRKGGAEPMVHWEKEITIAVGKVASLQLDQQTALQVELLTNAQMSAKQWAARVSVVSGGVQPVVDQFPFLAPLEGYQAGLELNLNTPKPPTWISLYQGGQFYVKTARGYGRMELKTISGKSFMRVTVFLNPSNSRNLEYDPAKEIRTDN